MCTLCGEITTTTLSADHGEVCERCLTLIEFNISPRRRETMELTQLTQLDTFLAWAKTCPFKFNISSMQSRRVTWSDPLKMVVHVKFELNRPEEEEEDGENERPHDSSCVNG